MKKIIVIGSGFAGLSAASFLSQKGYKVHVLEKHAIPGGRARRFQEAGFTFDMGPSWYWMPDVFERYFHFFGKKVEDYYRLKRLDPSYRVYWPDEEMDIPANYESLKQLFEQIEPGAGKALDLFMEEAAYKYRVGINKLVYKPGQSWWEFADLELIKGVFKLDVFNSMKKHIARLFKHPKICQLLEFPVLFLGALPQDTPALYSLMNYADIKLGTWYPEKGMYSIVEGMYQLAKELGVEFLFEHEVVKINIAQNKTNGIHCKGKNGEDLFLEADLVVSGADYHFTESRLLEKQFRSYSDGYWNKRVMAPSCLLYYVGLNKKLKNVLHHALFFDVSFDVHGKEIYTTPQWPSNPLFYVSTVSVTDETAAPAGHENLFFLIPIAAGLENDHPELREEYFKKIVKRFESRIGENISESIVYKRSYSVSDFKEDYNSFRGNAYGLANTLMQTAILKPSLRSKKVENLFYTGQLTVPGPGVPPSLISGEVVAEQVDRYFRNAVS